VSENKAVSPGNEEKSDPAQDAVMAIDILLEPDATMIEHAQAANAGLLKNFPKGYSLDDEHKPHISVMGGYVYTANLDKIFVAVDQVLATENVLSWKMKAFKYYYMPLKEIGLGGIVVEPTPDMVRLQRKLIDTLAPFMAPSGTAAAYATTPKDPEINQATLDAVATYISGHTGEHSARTSLSESARSIISTRWSLRHFPRSRFLPWECPSTNSATSERR
jgi:hypothetical protein